jgi:hypothetical protein
VWAAYAVPLCVLPSAVWRTGGVLDGGVSIADGGWYLLLLSGLSMGLALLTLGPRHDRPRPGSRGVTGHTTTQQGSRHGAPQQSSNHWLPTRAS